MPFDIFTVLNNKLLYNQLLGNLSFDFAKMHTPQLRASMPVNLTTPANQEIVRVTLNAYHGLRPWPQRWGHVFLSHQTSKESALINLNIHLNGDTKRQ